MKKHFWAIFMAFVMILTLIPSNLTLAASTTGKLKFRWADWSNNAPVENLNWDLNTELSDSPGFTRNMFFYFEDSTGATTRVQASELTSSDNTIVSLTQNAQNGDATTVEIVGFGQTSINYMKDGVTYSIDVDIDIPFAGFYSTATASQNSYIREFTVTDTVDTFYLVTTDDWTIDDVTLDKNLTSIASCTIDASKQFATIQVTGTPDSDNNIWYDIVYTLSNTKYGQSNWQNNSGIQIKNGKPALMWCYPEWDGNSHSKPKNPWWNTNLVNTPGCSNFYFSYIVNGVETPLHASDLVSSNSDVVKISQSSDNADMVWLEFLNFGNAVITYTDVTTGKIYEVPVTVTLPILGYYNSSIPSQTSYIKEFEVTDTKDTIYFIARDGWKFDNIYLNSEFDAIADLTLDASKTVATIKITGNPTVNTWNYQVHYLATNPNIGGQMNDHLGISLTSKKPHIEFAAPDGMGNINYFNCISMAPGYTSDMWIVFNDGQGGETYTIPLDKLESNNKDVFTISSAGDSNNPDMFTLTTVGWGRGQLVYTDSNGKMYTVDVLSDIEHQNLGFYKEDKISKENWIPNEYVLKNKTKRFYFMAQNGWTFDNFVLDGDAKNFATLTLSEDKACVTITFTDKLKEYFTFDEKFMFGFEFTSKDAFGNSYTNHYGLNITNYLCEHPITYIKDKKEATNTTAGYTGDIVCEKCQDIVEVGKVIPVISDAISVNKGDVFTYGGYKYKALGNNAVAFCGVEGGNTKKITIPKTVTYAGENFKVTSIAKNAFKNNKKVTNITISENIMSIGNSAFSGCKNLKKIIIKSKKLKTVGKKAFKGIHKKAAIKVPKNKLKSYKKLLKGKGQASTVKIKK